MVGIFHFDAWISTGDLEPKSLQNHSQLMWAIALRLLPGNGFCDLFFVPNIGHSVLLMFYSPGKQSDEVGWPKRCHQHECLMPRSVEYLVLVGFRQCNHRIAESALPQTCQKYLSSNLKDAFIYNQQTSEIKKRKTVIKKIVHDNYE